MPRGFMKQSPLLQFRCDAFAISPDEDAATNPGIFGRSLAEWLSGALRARGWSVGAVVAEDFGWCVPVDSQPHALYVACASAGAEPGTWRVFVFAEGGLLGRLLGRGDTRADDLARTYEAVRSALVVRPDIHDVTEEHP